MIRVAVVDDQALVRAGFAMVLGSQEDITVAWEAAHGQEAIDRQARDPVDVVVMDVQMPVMDGIAATGPITGSGAKVIVVTTFDSSNYVMNALQAGASGFLLKDSPPEEFIEAVRTVGSGSAIISPAATATLIRGLQGENTQPPQEADLGGLIEPLTPREEEILRLIGLGLSNDEIAAKLFISMPTVKTHVSRVLSKTGSRDRVHAVLFAFSRGVVTPTELLQGHTQG